MWISNKDAYELYAALSRLRAQWLILKLEYVTSDTNQFVYSKDPNVKFDSISDLVLPTSINDIIETVWHGINEV